MKNNLKFILMLGNTKFIAASRNGQDIYYGKTSPCGGGAPNLKKLAACLNSRI